MVEPRRGVEESRGADAATKRGNDANRLGLARGADDDPSGRMLVAQHNLPVDVRDGDAVRTIPAGLSVFRIGDDGKLAFVRKYDIDGGGKTMFWMGMVLP